LRAEPEAARLLRAEAAFELLRAEPEFELLRGAELELLRAELELRRLELAAVAPLSLCLATSRPL
jgi:hypothetical protein